MRCPQCEFENMPNRDRCFQCGSVLKEAQTPLDVNPPRMAYWKRPLRYMFRCLRQQRVISSSNRMAKKIPLPRWMRKISHDAVISVIFSVIPGLSHYLQKRFKEIRWYCLAWGVVLCTSLFLYGSNTGMGLFGLTIGLHAWIAVHGATPKGGITFKNRVTSLMIMLVCVFGLYRLIGRTVFYDLADGYTNMNIPYHNIKSGDYLLAQRSNARKDSLLRGSMVLTNLPTIGAGLYRSQNMQAFVEIVGLAGETVTVKNRRFIINGQEKNSEKYPVPNWFPKKEFTIVVPGNSYFINPDYKIRGDGMAINAVMVKNACVISANDIEARAFIRWMPLTRRGFLKEIE